MDEDRTPRELAHELGNALQEKVALQYLLTLAAERIEHLARVVADEAEQEEALKAAERFRRCANL